MLQLPGTGRDLSLPLTQRLQVAYKWTLIACPSNLLLLYRKTVPFLHTNNIKKPPAAWKPTMKQIFLKPFVKNKKTVQCHFELLFTANA